MHRAGSLKRFATSDAENHRQAALNDQCRWFSSDSEVVQESPRESLFKDRYFVSRRGIAKRFKDPVLVCEREAHRKLVHYQNIKHFFFPEAPGSVVLKGRLAFLFKFPYIYFYFKKYITLPLKTTLLKCRPLQKKTTITNQMKVKLKRIFSIIVGNR